MKRIPKVYERNGFRYESLGRLKDVALYSQTDMESGIIVGYEVVIIKHYKEGQKVFGKDVTGHEYLPAQSKWGRFGFTFYKLESATRKMIQLANRELDKQ